MNTDKVSPFQLYKTIGTLVLSLLFLAAWLVSAHAALASWWYARPLDGGTAFALFMCALDMAMRAVDRAWFEWERVPR